MLPKDIFVKVEDQRTPGGLEPEAWATLRRVLDLIESCKVEGDPQSIFESLEQHLRSNQAKLIE